MNIGDYIDSKLRNNFLRKIHRRFYKKEKVVIRKKGKYPDKFFYIIRVRYENVGIMGYLRYVLFKVIYAVKRGYIPVVDMKNGKNSYLNNNEVGKINSWEYFFKQPCGYGLEDIRSAKNIVYSSLDSCESDDLYATENYEYIAKYILFTDEISSQIDSIIEKWKNKGINYILGLKIRGTDYILKKPYLHAKQPTVDEFIKIVDECIHEQICMGGGI